MNLDELRSAQAKERRKDSLQHLRDAFYDDVAAYIDDLRAARDRRAEQVDKPFSDDDVRRMSDEIETAEEVAEALYERRVGKVVKLASFAAADMPTDTEGMTSHERELFDDLVARIERNKSTVLDVIAGEADPDPDPDAAIDPSTADGTRSRGDRTRSESSPDGPRADAGSGPGSPPEADDRPAPPDEPTTGGGTTAGSRASSTGDAPPTGDDAGALADAMGGDGSDAGENVPDAEADGPGTADATAEDGSAPDGGIDPTPVDPDPAPPGGPTESGGAPDGRAGRPDGGDGTPVGDAPAPEDAADSGREDAERPGPTPPDRDRATVRITRDVGEILGVDERAYELASEDVVTLPTENAEPLVQRDAAEWLD